MTAKPSLIGTSAGLPEKLRIDFLFLDLTTCTRCLGADASLEAALDAVDDVLAPPASKPRSTRSGSSSREQARALRFVSSPTIRVDGATSRWSCARARAARRRAPTAAAITSPAASGCYRGQEYTEPPVAMIVDAILRRVYGPAPLRRSRRGRYELPENLRAFLRRPAPRRVETRMLRRPSSGPAAPPKTRRTCCGRRTRAGLRLPVSAPRARPGRRGDLGELHGPLLAFIAGAWRPRQRRGHPAGRPAARPPSRRRTRALAGGEAAGPTRSLATRSSITTGARRYGANGPPGIDVSAPERPASEPATDELRRELAACLTPLLRRLPAACATRSCSPSSRGSRRPPRPFSSDSPPRA